jgi:ubiquinone/menaquinone biosynthesis C-methylase UbiE
VAHDTNPAAHSTDEVVRFYRESSWLDAVEERVLRDLAEQLPGMRMLDLGVGGGRTSMHFAPLVREYVGVDYSPAMIDACRERFAEANWNAAFQVGDARSMPTLPDNTFDFILFSFNGIDSMQYADRARVFKEIKRVGKHDAIFYFSSHNMQYFDALFRPSWSPSLSTFIHNSLRMAVRYVRLRKHNPHFERLRRRDYAVLRDGSHDFTIYMVYVRPRFQLEELRAAGLRDVRAYRVSDGHELAAAELEAVNDAYVYYSCRL